MFYIFKFAKKYSLWKTFSFKHALYNINKQKSLLIIFVENFRKKIQKNVRKNKNNKKKLSKI